LRELKEGKEGGVKLPPAGLPASRQSSRAPPEASSQPKPPASRKSIFGSKKR
jgi:hypothetical protein